MTVREEIKAGASFLTGTGVETPYLDAVVLLARAMKTTKEKLYAAFTDAVEKEQAAVYRDYLHRRKKGMPVSYIRREKEFYGRMFYVDERVLIPRPDTEIAVDEALEILRSGNMEAGPPRVLDLCTGSGCIAVSLAAESEERNLPARIHAADISASAEEVFNLNCKYLLKRQIPFYLSDLFDSVKGKFNLIVSNPPYLEQADMDRFREIHWPEPELALFGGEKGLEIIGRIIKKSVEYLHRNGYLLLEAAPGQMDAMEFMLKEKKFSGIRRVKDLGGRERVIISRYCHG